MNTAMISNPSIENELLRVSHNNFEAPINRLLQHAEMLLFKKGHILFNIGNIARGLYVIGSGKMKVSKFGVDGKEQIIKIIGVGDVIGHEALLNDHRFYEYAEVLEDAEIYYVSRADFELVCTNEPSVMTYLTQLLCNDLKKVEDRLVASAYEPVRGRLSSILLELADIYKNGNESVINLCRADLANMVGTAKETSIRLLSEFKNEDLIDINGQEIMIKDVEGLKRMACLYK